MMEMEMEKELLGERKSQISGLLKEKKGEKKRNFKKEKITSQMLQNWEKTSRFSCYIHLSGWRRRKAES